MLRIENRLKVMNKNCALEETLETHMKNVEMQFLNKNNV